MDFQTVTAYITQYGTLAIFVIVFLEYLNLPGFPAGIIMPAAGIFAAQGNLNLPWVLLLSVAAGLLGSWMLYGVGLLGGKVGWQRLIKKHPAQAERIEKAMEKLREKGGVSIFFFKLLPAVRTIISIPAGVIKMNFASYTFFSTLGIVVWNAVFIGGGYLFGEKALQLFAR